MRLLGSCRNPMPQYPPSVFNMLHSCFSVFRSLLVSLFVFSLVLALVVMREEALMLVRELCCGFDKGVLREAETVELCH